MNRDASADGDPAFDDAYYREQGLDRDRLALWYYARVARRLFARPGRVLDFGCGTGHLLRRLSQGFEAYGYDVSALARVRCRENAPDAVVLEEWESLPPGTLDGIVALHTLEHVPRPLSLVTALVERLTTQGRMLVVVPNTGSPGRTLKGDQWFALRDPTHYSLLSRGEWATVLKRAGLRILWIRGDGLWDAPYVRWLPTAAQRPLFVAPAALQLLSPIAQPFLPASLGECLIIAAEKE
jgi:SAM-dependent methyltransferase